VTRNYLALHLAAALETLEAGQASAAGYRSQLKSQTLTEQMGNLHSAAKTTVITTTHAHGLSSHLLNGTLRSQLANC
jgi:hypothetical protein